MFRTNTLLSFLVVSLVTASAMTMASAKQHDNADKDSHFSGSGFKLILAGYNGTVTPYTFTPETKIQQSGAALKNVGSSPSWVSFSPDQAMIYTTDESNNGTVYAVRVDEARHINSRVAKRTSNAKTSFDVVGRAETGGAGPVSSALARNLLFVANYNGGSASVHQLEKNGKFTSQKPEQVFQFHRSPKGSSGPVQSRQNQSYAHEVAAEPSRRWVYVPDLGADMIHRLSIPTNGQAKEVKVAGNTTVAPGSGPRHLAFWPTNKMNTKTYAYLASELATTLTAFEISQEDGSLKMVDKPVSALPEGVSPGANQTTGNTRTTSEVAVSPDGKFVYVGTRGDKTEDHISVFKRDAETGAVKFQDWYASGGRNLRHFSLTPEPLGRYIAAGHQDTGNVTILARDADTGALKQTATVQNVGQVAFAGFATGPSHLD